MFTGVAGAALLKVLAPLLEVLFNALGKSFNDWLAQKRADQANRDLGASTVTASINKEAADAERRADQAGEDLLDVDAVLDRMVRGERI